MFKNINDFIKENTQKWLNQTIDNAKKNNDPHSKMKNDMKIRENVCNIGINAPLYLFCLAYFPLSFILSGGNPNFIMNVSTAILAFLISYISFIMLPLIKNMHNVIEEDFVREAKKNYEIYYKFES